MGSVTPAKTEKSLSLETHIINLSTYDCIVFFLQYDFYLVIGSNIYYVCVVPCLSVVQVKLLSDNP